VLRTVGVTDAQTFRVVKADMLNVSRIQKLLETNRYEMQRDDDYAKRIMIFARNAEDAVQPLNFHLRSFTVKLRIQNVGRNDGQDGILWEIACDEFQLVLSAGR
jgi:hypothetical protein